MIYAFFYFLAIVFELLFAISFSIYTISLIYSNTKGSPYVPTKNKEVETILKEANLKKNLKFYELGCGDARVSRIAAKKYKVKSVAVDVNPILVRWARFLAKMKKVEGIVIIRKNIFQVDISQADIVYLFLMPELIKKLMPKFETELKKNTVIISHGFKIEGWETRLYKTISHIPFPTYFYRV